jgi:hypothetical protein
MVIMDELYERKSNLEERIANYFEDDEVHYGDQGYQDLLEQLVSIEMEITRDELDEISETI